MGSAQEAIKKKRNFKSYEESSRTFTNKCNKVKQLKRQLAELDETYGTSRKFNKNFKETTVEDSPASITLCTDIMAELKQAVEASEEATTRCDKAAEDMFQLYPNLLSIDTRYVWSKIVQDQTNADPYKDSKG